MVAMRDMDSDDNEPHDDIPPLIRDSFTCWQISFTRSRLNVVDDDTIISMHDGNDDDNDDNDDNDGNGTSTNG
jgi:hypothetical protein